MIKKSFLIVVPLILSMLIQSKTIYIIPFGPTFTGNALFNSEERDGTLIPFCELKKAAIKLGYNIKAVYTLENLPDVAAIVFLNTHNEYRFMNLLQFYNCPKILYIWEPPLNDNIGYNATYYQYFTKVFSLSSDLVDNKKVFKWYYPQPSLHMIDKLPRYEDKKLCTMIIGRHYSNYPGELYSARLQAIEFFSRYGTQEFEFYGGGWSAQQYPCYRGTVKNKAACLKNYRFSLCYENTNNVPGYLTEKIFDCFVAGCVPVYWGDPAINHSIPHNCFINRYSFSSLDQLYHYLKNMPREVYQEYLDNIQRFLTSPAAYRFSIPAFIDTFLSAIEPHYNKNIIFN